MAESMLSDEQRARVEALSIARELLVNKGFASGSIANRTIGELMAMAEYILWGTGYEDEPEDDDPVSKPETTQLTVAQ